MVRLQQVAAFLLSFCLVCPVKSLGNVAARGNLRLGAWGVRQEGPARVLVASVCAPPTRDRVVPDASFSCLATVSGPAVASTSANVDMMTRARARARMPIHMSVHIVSGPPYLVGMHLSVWIAGTEWQIPIPQLRSHGNSVGLCPLQH